MSVFFKQMQKPLSVCLLVLAGVAGLLSSGCTSLHINRDALKEAPFDSGGQIVYVVNPEMKQEMKILRSSGIYHLSENPEGANKLKLLPMGWYRGPVCGNPLILSGLTLGILPGWMPASIDFNYELETNAGWQRFTHQLPVHQRYSIWECFFKWRNDSVLSRALKYSKRETPHNYNIGYAPR